MSPIRRRILLLSSAVMIWATAAPKPAEARGWCQVCIDQYWECALETNYPISMCIGTFNFCADHLCNAT